MSSPAHSQLIVAAPLCSPVRQDLGCPVTVGRRRIFCDAVRAADVGVSDEWAGLLDPGEGSTRSHGRSKRPALRAKGVFS